MAHAGGRPLLYKTPGELQEKIDAYFEDCKKSKEIPTIAGLAYAIGIDRQTVYNYEKKDEFFDTIKNAREYIISRLEANMVNNRGNITGSIFVSKQYGYRDRQDLKVTVKGSLFKVLDDKFFEGENE